MKHTCHVRLTFVFTVIFCHFCIQKNWVTKCFPSEIRVACFFSFHHLKKYFLANTCKGNSCTPVYSKYANVILIWKLASFLYRQMMRKKVNENEMMWTKKLQMSNRFFFVWLANLPLKAVIKIYAHKKTETEVMAVAILSLNATQTCCVFINCWHRCNNSQKRIPS